ATPKITTADQTYFAAPYVMKDGTKKPTYVQVSDKRGTLAGWKLTLSKPELFKTASGEVVDGGQLPFTSAEAASMVD
ncbi:WxL domain-containing protein, partial [Enterococcus faecalis]|uniref:WxL domain-containing protein n=1 Tax=Enterococcus faecalis TaxID=1351 RepID=UPI003CC533E6